MKRQLILAVSHDAGGAEVLSSFLKQKSNKNNLISCVVDGPAVKIFCRKGLSKNILSVSAGRKLVSGGLIDVLITSTSYNSNLEREFIVLAKAKQIRTISILEHWINYKERFGYPKQGWENNLPGEIWTLDQLAKEIALSKFKDLVSIKAKRNYFWYDLKKQYQLIRLKKNTRFFGILFLGGVKNGGDSVKKMVGLKNFLCNYRACKPIFLKVRPHPAEDVLKYQVAMSKNYGGQNIKITLSNTHKESLVKELKRADLVIGIDSVALVIASFLGKQTVCLNKDFPIWLEKSKVIKIKRAKDLSILLDKIIE